MSNLEKTRNSFEYVQTKHKRFRKPKFPQTYIRVKFLDNCLSFFSRSHGNKGKTPAPPILLLYNLKFKYIQSNPFSELNSYTVLTNKRNKVDRKNLHISDSSAFPKEVLDVHNRERPWQIQDKELSFLIWLLGLLWFCFYFYFLNCRAQLKAEL